MTRLFTPDERAEALGEMVGRSAASAAQRLRSLATDNLPAFSGGTETTGGDSDAVTQRAEYVVSSIETAAVTYSRVVTDRLRRVFARAREEMEDVVAEAQSRRGRGGREPAAKDEDEDLVSPS
jgi:hypothetical protein